MPLQNQMIAVRLKELRGEKSQREVADAVGASPEAISDYEAGKRIPSDEVKLRIANYYGVSIDEIFFTERQAN